jgi:hypothetical protein
MASASAGATTTLAVDLSSPIGPAGHVASGSLYGVTETVPTDVTALIAPLHPNMFTNPAADVQQPVGDAIVVAGRVAPIGARVTIRLADLFPRWPYAFTTMTDWSNKVAQTAARKKAAGLANIYGYEIWNEPDGTWKSSNPLAFNDFWKQTYAQLRQLDPGVKIVGPSISYYSDPYLRSFLSFCKANGCLPDIVGWHELGGGNLTGNVQAYRSLEAQLGIGPLPISINEYSGAGHIDVEGQPGASAPIIAKLERLRIDSACISYWDVAHPGRLGSLLATNTEPNGGWWFYRWYGDMSGDMVSTTPPMPANVTALDGLANLDTAGQRASVLFGGANDGTVQIIVKGFRAATFFGPRVRAVVEHTPWAGRTVAVRAADTVSTSELPVSDDQIAVTVANTNGTDGYRLSLTPPAGGTSGAAGAGGAAGTGGAAGRAGADGTGGATTTGGGGGMSGRGGMGSGGTPGSAGGGAAGAAGQTGTGGSKGGGGESAGAGGGAGDAGDGAGGSAGSAGGGAAGVSGAAGAAGRSAGDGAAGAAVGGAAGTSPNDAAGCSCAVDGPRSQALERGILLLALVTGRVLRRRRTR